MLVKSGGWRSANLTKAPPASAPKKSSCRAASGAKAHAVFAKSSGLHSSSLTNALPAIASNNSSCRTASVPKAHAVLAKPCGLNSSSLVVFRQVTTLLVLFQGNSGEGCRPVLRQPAGRLAGRKQRRRFRRLS